MIMRALERLERLQPSFGVLFWTVVYMERGVSRIIHC